MIATSVPLSYHAAHSHQLSSNTATMRLTLKVLSYCESPPVDEKVRHFDQFPIIIGRSVNCDYSLKDPSRYISSNHAVISEVQGQLSIEDTSANGVFINGSPEPVGRGQSQRLAKGDSLAIGDYKLDISISSHSAAASPGQPADPFDDFNFPDTPPVPPYDPFRGKAQDWTPPSDQHNDPFFDDTPSEDITPEPRVSNPPDWASWVSEDPSTAEQNPAHRQENQQPPAASAPPASDRDDLDWLPGSREHTHTPDPGQRRGDAANRATREIPLAPGEDRSPVRDASGSPNTAGAESGRARLYNDTPMPSHALMHILKGAGVSADDLPAMNDAESLEHIGELLAQMVDAMMVLLQSRAELKNVIRSDRTTLTRTGNNPLKFSVHPSDALTRLLSDSNDGYMPSGEAIQEAIDDLKQHQLAMLDGMKASVKSLLLQFNPDRLSKKLEKTGGISANIPITREAKLWALFCDQYDAISDEAVNDFGDLFGKEFRKAYESRLQKLGRDPDF